MYYGYFGLKQPPFKITPDTHLFFPGGNRGPILEALMYAIVSGEGIVKVVGEVGSGKTMLCRMLAVELPANVDVVYLANPSVAPEHILDIIAFELKLPIRASDSRLQVMQTLQDWLLKRHAENHLVVVFIEEAQSMPVETLEEIRLLSNLETQQHKLLQIVLFGQPELDQLLGRAEIRQLKERITYNFKLLPFKPGEIRDYVNARLRTCGYMGAELFTPAAIREVARRSNGLVRRINILADKSLLAAYAANGKRVTSRHVKAAARDSEFVARWGWLRAATRAVVGFVIVGAIVLWAWDQALWKSDAFSELAALAMGTVTHELTVGGGEEAIDEVEPVEPAEPASVPDAVPDASLAETDTVAVDAPADGLAHSRRAEEVAYRSASLDLFPIAEESRDVVAVGPNDELVLAMDLPDEHQPTATSLPSNAVQVQLETALGIAPVSQVDDMPLGQLSAKEAARLEQQIAVLPPEVVFDDGPVLSEKACTRCTSIIYRAIPASDAHTRPGSPESR